MGSDGVVVTAPGGLVLSNGDMTIIDGNYYVVKGESLITVGGLESPAYAGGMGLDVETTDEEARQRAIISQMDARKHACAYCRNEFRADKRGACASCGAPQG